MRDKDLVKLSVTLLNPKSYYGLASTLCSLLWSAERKITLEGERVSIVFSRLRCVDACRAQGTL